MSLRDVDKKLYSRDSVPNPDMIGSSEYDPRSTLSKTQLPASSPSDVWIQKQKGLTEVQKQKLKKTGIVLGAVMFLALGAFGLWQYRQASFSEDRVIVEIVGTQSAESGKLITYEILIRNSNRAKLKNAILKLTYPENFKPEESLNFVSTSPTSGTFTIGEILPQGEDRMVLNARMYSPRGALMYLKAALNYSPSIFSTQFEKEVQLGINVGTTPISLEVLAPQNVSSGDEVNYLVNYKNTGAEKFDGIRIRAEYPEGFVFSTADPAALESNNTWYIGALAPGESGKIVVNGKLEGETDHVKKMKFLVGTVDGGNFISYNEEEAQTKIVSSPFSIAQTVNGVKDYHTQAGDSLSFEINYKNNGNVGLKDVIVTSHLESPVLDYATLDMDGGFFDSSTKTITWKASDYPELKNLSPNQGGIIRFSVKVKEMIPVSGGKDKNFVVSSLSKIDSPDVPTPIHMNKIIAGNKLDIKLNSKLFLDVKGYYKDPNIQNSGPVPPKVDQETTYTVHWIASNVSNDVSEARVEAVLPTSVTMTGTKFPDGSNLTYNERNNSIVWEIGNMTSGTGILSSPKEVSFQVKIKPEASQVGKKMDLIGESKFTAKDLFTGDNLVSVFERKTTELREDSSIGDAYTVVQ